MQARKPLYDDWKALFGAAGILCFTTWSLLPPDFERLTKATGVVTDVTNVSKSGVRLTYRDASGETSSAMVLKRHFGPKRELNALNGQSVEMLLLPSLISSDATVYVLSVHGRTMFGYEQSAARDWRSASTLAIGALVMSGFGVWSFRRQQRRDTFGCA